MKQRIDLKWKPNRDTVGNSRW